MQTKPYSDKPEPIVEGDRVEIVHRTRGMVTGRVVRMLPARLGERARGVVKLDGTGEIIESASMSYCPTPRELRDRIDAVNAQRDSSPRTDDGWVGHAGPAIREWCVCASRGSSL